MASELRKKAARLICDGIGDDWSREGPGGLMEAYGPIADAVLSLALEEAAKRADAWRDPSALRFAAGEMTAQELRTAKAVAKGITSAIRALIPAEERE